MITIVEPKEHIAKLWGKQKVRESDTYRLMRYVLRVDHEGKVLLHNVVTGQLVVLSEEEARALDQLPTAYTPTMEQLVSEHYLVPETFDEHQQVISLKEILWKMHDAQRSKDIVHYTILPTTACNARCYYCFEQGCETVTMTKETADELVNFIATHCRGNKVGLSWFGGEPTVGMRRIDQICEGLQKRSIEYTSDMITNGYLFDEKTIETAVVLWHLDRVMICFDGTEENYNRTKAYVDAKCSPYQRVMRNVGLLLDHGIFVSLRMNFDIFNYEDFEDLVKECVERFHGNPLLEVWAHPINGEHLDHNGRNLHAQESWFREKVYELNSISRHAGLSRNIEELPCLRFTGCAANRDSSITVTPRGSIVSCAEQFGDEEIKGDLQAGITNYGIVKAWKQFAYYEKCIACRLFPYCMRVKKCNVKDTCTFVLELTQMHIEAIRNTFATYLDCNNWEESRENVFQGT